MFSPLFLFLDAHAFDGTSVVARLVGTLIYDGSAVPVAARTHPRVANVHRRRHSRLVVVMVMVAAVVAMVVAVMLTHGNIFLVVIVLARGFRAETHIGLPRYSDSGS